MYGNVTLILLGSKNIKNAHTTGLQVHTHTHSPQSKKCGKMVQLCPQHFRCVIERQPPKLVATTGTKTKPDPLFPRLGPSCWLILSVLHPSMHSEYLTAYIVLIRATTVK